jgi:hypothetical protein
LQEEAAAAAAQLQQLQQEQQLQQQRQQPSLTSRDLQEAASNAAVCARNEAVAEISAAADEALQVAMPAQVFRDSFVTLSDRS